MWVTIVLLQAVVAVVAALAALLLQAPEQVVVGGRALVAQAGSCTMPGGARASALVVVQAMVGAGVRRTGTVEKLAAHTCRAQPRANSVAMRTRHRCNHLRGWMPLSMSCCLARSANLVSTSHIAGP